MRRAWIKFKFWLIKKLGGETHSIEFRYARPVTLTVQQSIDLRYLEGDRRKDAELVIHNRLADRLAEELFSRGLVEIKTEDDLVYCKRRYTARVMIYFEKGVDDEQRKAD